MDRKTFESLSPNELTRRALSVFLKYPSRPMLLYGAIATAASIGLWCLYDLNMTLFRGLNWDWRAWGHFVMLGVSAMFALQGLGKQIVEHSGGLPPSDKREQRRTIGIVVGFLGFFIGGMPFFAVVVYHVI